MPVRSDGQVIAGRGIHPNLRAWQHSGNTLSAAASQACDRQTKPDDSHGQHMLRLEFGGANANGSRPMRREWRIHGPASSGEAGGCGRSHTRSQHNPNAHATSAIMRMSRSHFLKQKSSRRGSGWCRDKRAHEILRHKVEVRLCCSIVTQG